MKLSDYLKQQSLTHEKFGIVAGLPTATVWRIATRGVVPNPVTADKIYRATKGAVTHMELFYPVKMPRKFRNSRKSIR